MLATTWDTLAGVAAFLAAWMLLASFATLWDGKIEYVDKVYDAGIYLGATAVLATFAAAARTVSHFIIVKAKG